MKSTPLTPALYEYVIDLFGRKERDLLTRMARRARKASMPAIMISEDQARFLTVLLALARPRRILDVGTLFGYSAAILARGSPASQVISLELEARHAEVAAANLRAAGLAGRVAVRLGPGLDSMRRLRSGSFDLVLLDADKGNYPNYLEESARLLRAGGVLLIDNVFAWGEAASDLPRDAHGGDVAAIQRTNRLLSRDRRFTATILPLGDGLAFAVRNRGR